MAATEPRDLMKGVCCPLCGAESSISLNLSTCDEFNCPDCDDAFTTDTLRERIDHYRKLIRIAEAARKVAEAEDE